MTERRLAAILAADMVGYSRLMAIDEAGTLARLKALRKDQIDPEIARHGGEIVKLTGDGVLVLFGSVVGAVEAAAAIQRAVTATEAERAAETRIAFRIGINLGDVILDDGDVYGDGVNIAARLESQADSSGVTLSDDAFRQVRGKTDLRFIDLGGLSLKNIPMPVHAHKIDLAPDEGAPTKFEEVTGKKLEIPDKPSIAVLPFQNMSDDPEQAYFFDGVCEDIITELSRFSELFVIARNSSFSFKGRQVTHGEVARELGVRYMLEGSLRRAGKRLRITAQLIDCVTGAHVWAERYDRNLDDIFELQDEITRSVAGAIAPQIRKAEMDRVLNKKTMDVNSYELSLQAQALFHHGAYAEQERSDRVVEMARRALEMDSRNSHALWLNGYVHSMRYLYRIGADPDASLTEAWVAAEALTQTAQIDSRGLAVRGLVLHFRQQFDAATADLLRACDLNPNNAWSFMALAWHESLVGRTAEAREHAELVLRLSPRDSDLWVGDAYLCLLQAAFADGLFEDAIHWGERAIQMTPRAPIRRALMVASLGHLGQTSEARTHFEELAAFSPSFIDTVMQGGLVLYSLPAQRQLLIDGLIKAGVANEERA